MSLAFIFFTIYNLQFTYIEDHFIREPTNEQI
jgi:hypothetical protein